MMLEDEVVKMKYAKRRESETERHEVAWAQLRTAIGWSIAEDETKEDIVEERTEHSSLVQDLELYSHKLWRLDW